MLHVETAFSASKVTFRYISVKLNRRVKHHTPFSELAVSNEFKGFIRQFGRTALALSSQVIIPSNGTCLLLGSAGIGCYLGAVVPDVVTGARVIDWLMHTLLHVRASVKECISDILFLMLVRGYLFTARHGL
jgi:hypothetical protein